MGKVRCGQVWYGQDGLDLSDQNDRSDKNDHGDLNDRHDLSAKSKKAPAPEILLSETGPVSRRDGRLRGSG